MFPLTRLGLWVEGIVWIHQPAPESSTLVSLGLVVGDANKLPPRQRRLVSTREALAQPEHRKRGYMSGEEGIFEDDRDRCVGVSRQPAPGTSRSLRTMGPSHCRDASIGEADERVARGGSFYRDLLSPQ